MSSDTPLNAAQVDDGDKSSLGETENRLGNLSLVESVNRRTGTDLARRSFERSRSPGDISGHSSPVDRAHHFLSSSSSSEKRATSPSSGAAFSFPSTSSASSTPVGTPTMLSSALPSISGSRSPNGRSNSISGSSPNDPFNFAGSPSLSNRPLEAAKHQHHRSRSINMGGFSPVMKGGKLINFGTGPISISGPGGDGSSSDGSSSSNPGSPLSSSPASGNGLGAGFDPGALGPGFNYALPRAPSPLQQSHTPEASSSTSDVPLSSAGTSSSPTLAAPLSSSPSGFTLSHNHRDSRTIDFATAARGWESPVLPAASLPLPIPIGQYSLSSLRAAAAASERARSPKPLSLGEPQVTSTGAIGGSLSYTEQQGSQSTTSSSNSNAAQTSGSSRRASGHSGLEAALPSPKYKSVSLATSTPSQPAQAQIPASTSEGSLSGIARPISPRLNAWPGGSTGASPGSSPSSSSHVFASSPSARLGRASSPSLRVLHQEAGPSRGRTPSPARERRTTEVSRAASISPPLEADPSMGRLQAGASGNWDSSWPDVGAGSRAIGIGLSSSPSSRSGGARLERGLSSGSGSSGGSPGTSPNSSAAAGFLAASTGLGIGPGAWKFPSSPRNGSNQMLAPHARQGRGPRSDTSRSRTPSPSASGPDFPASRSFEGEGGVTRPIAIWATGDNRAEAFQKTARQRMLGRNRTSSSSSASSNGSAGEISEEDSPVRVRPNSRLSHSRTVSVDSAPDHAGYGLNRTQRSSPASKHNRKVSDPTSGTLQSPPSAMLIAHGSAKAEVDARLALSENTKGKAGAAGGLIADEVDAFSERLPPPAIPPRLATDNFSGMSVDDADPLSRPVSSDYIGPAPGGASAALSQLVRPTPLDARLLPPFGSGTMTRSGSGNSSNALGLGGPDGLSSGAHSPGNPFSIQAPQSPRMGNATLGLPDRILLGLRSRSPSPAAMISPSPFDPLRRSSASSSSLSGNHEVMNGESPPKMRSFIGMPPRSGYDLSDDPDDVGSEGSASSTDGREGSIGGGDEDGMDEGQDDDVHDEGKPGEESASELSDDGDSQSQSEAAGRRGVRGLPSDISRSTLFARRQNASASSDGDNDDNPEDEREGIADEADGREQRRDMRESRAPSPPTEDSSPLSRPNVSRKPSLTRSNAVPPPPELDDSRKVSPGTGSVLGFFHGEDPESQADDSSDWGAPLARQAGGRGAGSVSEDDDPDTSINKGDDWMPPSSQGTGSDLEDPASESEDALTTLERVFLFAKSDLTYHRIIVSQCLAEWILDVKLSDAVEYIIPLLNGLSTDEREVCEAFSPELHRIMWFFFRNCPLKQSAPSQVGQDASLINGSAHPNGSAVETAVRPQLEVSTFTPLLCALLLNQNTDIARSTQNAIVQFCSRLHRDSEGILLSEDGGWTTQLADRCEGDHTFLIESTVNRDGKDILYEPYHFGPEARELVEQEILQNVAIAIGSRNAHRPQEMEDLPETTELGHGNEEQSSSAPMQKSNSMEAKDAEHSSSQDSSTSTSELGETSREDSSWDPESQADSQMEDVWRSDGALFDASSPHMGPFGSGDFDEEAAVARMAGVSMLAALASEGILHVDIVTKTFVPQMVSLKKDPAFFVRKEVAVSLGCLAKSIKDQTVIQDQLLPTLDAHLHDSIWHVRQAACLSMPAVLTQADDETQRMRAVAYLRHLVEDVSRHVRQAALEVIGELVFMFRSKEGGVPEELINFFLGEPLDGPDEHMSENGAAVSGEGRSQLESSDANSQYGFVGALQINSDSGWGGGIEMYGQGDIDDRAVVTAFNFPAIVYTVGAEQWPRLRSLHAELAQDHTAKVRRSLASSLHEIAKIIGPEASQADLLPLFDRFLQDQDNEIKSAVIENVDVFLAQLPQEHALAELRSMQERWLHAFGRDWRLRHRLAAHVSTMADRFLLIDEDANLIALMQLAIADSVSAVRDAGIDSIAKMYTIFSEHDQAAADGFLALVDDLGNSSSYRIRVASLMAINALVHSTIQRAALETILLQRLVATADDDVIDVRIVLGRCVAAMCQKDELYGLTQSRSPELLDLIAKLARDISPEVRQQIHSLLSEEERAAAEKDALENANAAPKSSSRVLVLGPKDGGPHREARSSSFTVISMDQSADVDSHEDLPAFAMDEDSNEDSQPQLELTLPAQTIRINHPDADDHSGDEASALSRSPESQHHDFSDGGDFSAGDVTQMMHADDEEDGDTHTEESQLDTDANIFTQRSST